MKIHTKIFMVLAMFSIFASCKTDSLEVGRALFQFQNNVETRWISFENPEGEIGKGGKMNKGAKGAAMYYINPGETKTIAQIDGTGIINRIWMTGGFVHTPEDRRNMLIEIYWDGDEKPAVSAPINDFFGIGLPIKTSFQTVLFSQPEGRSYNSFVQMPFRKSAKVVIKNKTKNKHMLFFDINYTRMKRLPENSMYFHAFWHRNLKTELKRDFEILPSVKGKGRFLGCNIGVMCDTIYRPSWFGEGEVKMFLDSDTNYPTLCGTGTEDYIGTGWGQDAYVNMTQGSAVSNVEKGLYAFYRYHTVDPIFFNKACRVTIQQLGNASKTDVMNMLKKGAELEVVSVWSNERLNKIYDNECESDINNANFPEGGVNFYRRDDVCSTAYFYLDKTSTDLPEIQNESIRSNNLQKLK